MPTIKVVVSSSLQPDQVLAAARDFSDRREEVFPAVSIEGMEVHEVGESSADVTERTSTGLGSSWERCDYDWSKTGS